MKEPRIGDIIFFKKNAWYSVEFHLIKCANRLKGQICKIPPLFPSLFSSSSRKECTQAECNYSVHVRTVQLKSVLFTVKKRVEHYLHLGLHGKGNRYRNKFINQLRAPGGHIQITIMIDTQQQYINNCGAGTLGQEKRYMHIYIHTLTHIYMEGGGGGGGGVRENIYIYIRCFITNLQETP